MSIKQLHTNFIFWVLKSIKYDCNKLLTQQWFILYNALSLSLYLNVFLIKTDFINGDIRFFKKYVFESIGIGHDAFSIKSEKENRRYFFYGFPCHNNNMDNIDCIISFSKYCCKEHLLFVLTIIGVYKIFKYICHAHWQSLFDINILTKILSVFL